MSSSAQSIPNATCERPISSRMGRCLLDCLACYAAAN